MKASLSSAKIVSGRVVRFTTIVAFVISLGAAVFPSALHFYYEIQYESGRIDAEARLQSKLVSQIIGQNPQLWKFETLRINEVTTPDVPDTTTTILDLDGELITEVGAESLSRPQASVSYPLYDAGMPVGVIQITVSLFDSLKESLAILIISSIAAFGVFFVLRTLPLRLLRSATNQASFLASHDPLTKLPNRALFNEWLLDSIADVDRQATSMAVLYLDLDHFKEVNDILGHTAGDTLLCQVTDRMSGVLRKNDVLARIGGDEFAIVQKHIDPSSDASGLADRLIASLSAPFDLDGHEVIIGVSAGVAVRAAGEQTDGPTLMRHADLALYKAKGDGRGVCRFFENDMNDALLARKKAETDLRAAISRNELRLHYQPQIDLASNRIKGVEALLRWYHTEDGLIAPDHFIPLAEETGLIVPVGAWVIREACREARAWPELTFAVNVSPVQFRQGNLVKTVRDALAAEGIAAGRLEIEITEGVLLNHTEETIATLTALQTMGVKIVMDDFGTGYSSLSYLRRFPFDKIKVDKSFTKDLGTCAGADSIVEAVIRLGAAMGMTANAEGVETAEQVRLLKKLGCDEVQGFYFSKPVPSASIRELLSDWQWARFDDRFAEDNPPGKLKKTA